MPKVNSKQAPVPAPQARQSKLVVFVDSDNTKRVLVPVPKTYKAALALAHRHFPSIPFDAVALQTDELEICQGERVYVTAEAWDEAIFHISRFHVVSNAEAKTVVVDLHQDPAPGNGVAAVQTLPRLNVTLDDNEKSMTFAIGYDTPLRRAMNFWARRFGDPCSMDNEPRCYFMGKRINPCETPRDLGLIDGDTIDILKNHLGGKPVIYLMSPVDVEAHVKLSLVPQWDFSAVYPVVPIKSLTDKSPSGEQIEWTVTTHSDGSLTEVSTGLEITYLFWEAHTNKSIPVSPPPSPRIGEKQTEHFVPSETSVNPSNAILLTIEELPKYLDKALSALGLHTEARTSFITYWLPSFLKYTYIALRFLPQASYERAAPLEIIPSPDVVTRIFMLFRGIDRNDLSSWDGRWAKQDDAELGMWREHVGVKLERALDGKLFRVLEWGGMEIDT